MLQRLWLHHVATTPSAELHEASYSLLKGDGIDGMLLHLFARGGFTNRVSVDIGAGDCVGGNSANLVLFHGFKSYMIDADAEGLMTGRRVYRTIGCPEPPVFINAMLTSSNVGDVLSAHGVPGRIDLLSVDIDSIDLYVVQAIASVARVVVVEFNNLWGPDESYSVPNVEGFRRELKEFLYGGASLAAFDKIMTAKGHKLVGIASSGFDALFVLDDADFRNVPAMSRDALYERSPIWRETHLRSLGHPIRTREWVRV